jgi:excisionase family DNA binding protein
MQLLTIDELSKLLSVTKKSVYDLVYTKRIPYTKIGNRLRFRDDLIESWVQERTHIPFGSQILYNKPSKVEGEESK